MMLKTILLLTIVATLLINEYQCVLTEEQMLKTAEMMRNICQPKFKVSDDIVDGIKSGQFPNDDKLKCYVNCVLEMMQVLKKGKTNRESAEKQIATMIPDHLKQYYTNGLNECIDAGKGTKDPCVVAYAILQCFYKSNPKFIFP